MTKKEIKVHNKEIRDMKKRNEAKLKKVASDNCLDTLNTFFGFK
jgi:uncharacterized membrane protein (DUF106 family)